MKNLIVEYKNEVVDGKETGLINVSYQLIGCDPKINEPCIISQIFSFYKAYLEKYPDQHLHPEIIESFCSLDNTIGLEAFKKYCKSSNSLI